MSKLKIYDTGRTTPGNSFSKRAATLKLGIEKLRCPYCGHHKLLTSQEHRKCARCKRYLPMSDRELKEMKVNR